MTTIKEGPIVLVGVLLLLAALPGCSTPQIGSDEAAFSTVDALYTAVCSRRVELLDRCEQDMAELRSAGKLPEEAHGALSSIAQEARGGNWQPAAERLSRFMSSQRRVR
jgi:hypothetical protein